jgi:hypothetical protein
MDAAVLTRVPAGVRARALPAAAMLTVLVAASSVLRFVVLALRLQTPVYLPDEYTYSALARSIAETGHPTIRGMSAHFPALLEPILAAPFWLTHDPALALRLTQAEHSVLMSLGAVPVYLLCRRLSLGAGYALAAAALTLVSADLSYASYVMAEPVAFPLVLTTVYAAVVALESPSRRVQLALIALIALSTFARLQLVLLAPVVLVAGLIVARFDLRRFVSTCGVLTAGLVLPVVAALAAGPQRLLGTYHGVLDLHATAGTVAHQLGLHLLLVVFVSSVVLVPGALVALGNGLARPQTVAEQSFAWLTVLLGAGVIAQAVFIGSTVSGGFGERYLIYVVPLIAAAFGLYARRGGSRAAVLALSALIALLAMRFPLTHYTGRSSDSPLLWAVSRVQLSLGSTNAALLVSGVALALAVLAAVIGLRPQRRYRAALAAAIAVQAVVAVAAVSWDVGINVQARRGVFPADMRWIDHNATGPVTMLQTPDSNRGAADEQFLWNMSLTRVGLLPGALVIDAYDNPAVRVANDGTLSTAHGTIDGAIVVDGTRTWTTFAGGRMAAATSAPVTPYVLWRPNGTAPLRLAAEARGVRSDGWLTAEGTLTVWPASKPHLLRLRLRLPAEAAADTIHFHTGFVTRDVTIQPGTARTISFLVPGVTHPWTLRWSCDRYAYRGADRVSFLTAPPQLIDA